MALLAEQIVQEWLTRKGYFTMRGLKTGIHEIDLLAAKHCGEGKWHHQHVEVQVSLRPVGYIAAFTTDKMKQFNLTKARSAKERSAEQLEGAVQDWVYKKFQHTDKVNLRKRLSNTDNWEYVFVYGLVRTMKEIELIAQQGITTISINEVLKELVEPVEKSTFTTSAATDILELLSLSKAQDAPIPPAV